MNDNFENPPPKIVSLATRTAYTPEPEIEPTPPGQPDEQIVKMLEEMLEKAKDGKIHGLAAITWSPISKKFGRYVWLPTIENLGLDMTGAMMIGGLSMLEEDMRDIAFWTGDYDPLSVSGESL